MLSWFGRYLDRLEETLAKEDDPEKDAGRFEWGEQFVPACIKSRELDFVRCLADLRHDSNSFYGLSHDAIDVVIQGEVGEFQSPAPVGQAAIDRVVFSWFPTTLKRSAVVIIPHWNGDVVRYRVFAKAFCQFGSTTAVLTLPYHGSRRLTGSRLANSFVSANIGQTIAAVRQGALDCIALCRWLSQQGFGRITVIGLSLGSCVASLAAAHSQEISRVALLLTAGDFGSVVLEGRATRHVRTALAGRVELGQVRRAWEIISPSSYVDRLARRNIPIMMVSGLRDNVILPKLSRRYEDALRAARAPLTALWLPCGHYTLGVLPFNLLAMVRLLQFVHALRR